MAGDTLGPWGRHGGGDVRRLDAAERQSLSKSIGSYVDRAVAFDPYLSKLGMDPDRDHGGGTWIGPASGSLLRYWSDEEPYSKAQGRPVVASLAVIFSTEDPPAWMRGTERWDDAEAARHEFRNFHSRVQYFDPDGGGRISEAYKGPATRNVMEAIEGAKGFMASDLVLGGGPEREPAPAPVDAPAELVTAGAKWVLANCKFAADFSYDEVAKDLWADVLHDGKEVFGISFDTENNDDVSGPFDVKVDGECRVTCQAFAAGGDWQCPVLYYRCQVMDGHLTSFGTDLSHYSDAYFVFIPGKGEGNPGLVPGKGKWKFLARNNMEDECVDFSERKGRAALKVFLAKCRREHEKGKK
jgi:hypothetical protein